LNSVYPQLESAWFHPLNLQSEKLVSNFAFKWVNLYRYIKAGPREWNAAFGFLPSSRPVEEAAGGGFSLGGGKKSAAERYYPNEDMVGLGVEYS
jgi:hypothetical protein